MCGGTSGVERGARQLEGRVRAHASVAKAPAPSTKTALRLVEELAPIASTEIGFHLVLAGLSRRPFDVSGLLSAAEILGIDHHVVEDGGMLRYEEQAA